MDWNNIDLTSGYERDQNFLDGYDFETLLLEIHCNMKTEEITRENVLKHAQKEMAIRMRSANEILLANIENIVNHVIADKNRE
jgi:hypothetical protein